MFENGSYLRRRKRFKKNENQLIDSNQINQAQQLYESQLSQIQPIQWSPVISPTSAPAANLINKDKQSELLVCDIGTEYDNNIHVQESAPTFLVKAEQSGDSGFEDCPDLDNSYNLYNTSSVLNQTNPTNPYNNPALRDYQLHLQQYHAWMYYQQNQENDQLVILIMMEN